VVLGLDRYIVYLHRYSDVQITSYFQDTDYFQKGREQAVNLAGCFTDTGF